jgi:hypothetical protein
MSGHGKKWDAAEKHFQEMELKLTRESRQIQVNYNTLLKENSALRDLLHKSEIKNAELTDHVNRLLEYTGLSKDDIKKACERDKSLADMGKMLGMFRGF